MIYFIQAERGGPIKIGTSNNVKSRLMEFQIGNPERLVLLGVRTGSFQEERDLHDELAKFHISGEWYSPSMDLIKLISPFCSIRPKNIDEDMSYFHNKLINDRKAADLMGLKVQTLRNWRTQCKGPKYYALGRAIRYSPHDIQDFIEEHAIISP